MHTTQNWKVGCFTYNNKVYQAGTQIVYSGPCIVNNNKLIVNNLIVSFMYYDGVYVYCQNEDNIYKFLNNEFRKNIIAIITDYNKAPPNTSSEIYWTDDMVAKTIWYIIIMLIGAIFYDRIAIWIFATIVWYFSTFKKK